MSDTSKFYQFCWHVWHFSTSLSMTTCINWTFEIVSIICRRKRRPNVCLPTRVYNQKFDGLSTFGQRSPDVCLPTRASNHKYVRLCTLGQCSADVSLPTRASNHKYVRVCTLGQCSADVCLPTRASNHKYVWL